MKRLTLTGLALFMVATLNAQIEDDWTKQVRESQENARKEFEQFAQQAYQEYEDFRRQANEEYARFMEEAWKMFDIQPAVEPPAKPKPPIPMVDNTKPSPTPQPDPNTDIKPKVDPIRIPDPLDVQQLTRPDLTQATRPKPVEPIVPTAVPMVAAQKVFLYGSPFAFHLGEQPELKLKDASEKSVAKMWKQLSDPSFDNVIAECLQQRDKRNLCDWAYLKLTQRVAEKQCGEGTNEAIVMQMYLLTQSGYQMRIGRDDSGHLALLIGSKEQIYRYKYFVMDGIKFYLIDRSFNKKGLSIFDHAFPKEKAFSLALTQPDLQVDKAEKRTITSKRYPSVSATVQTNRNLIAFYNEYPLSSMWNYYSMASLSDAVKDSLYPVLRKAIEGRTDLYAANILLNFVQTGFQYKTDDEQFGYERPLYPDESIYYPYCDCEDRSILFSCLVRELIGLEVVLLDYPEHISTAICFKDQEVAGDYFMMDGKKYVISDPTYIGANVGMCPSRYKTVRPNVIMFK